MIRTKHLYSLVLLALSVQALQAGAQSPPSKTVAPAKSPAPKKVPSPTKQTSLSVPFDLSADSLPANFTGHSCTELAEALKKLKPSKDEFESTESHTKRIEAIADAKLIQNLRAVDPIAFVVKLSEFQVKYNADEKWINLAVMQLGMNQLHRSSGILVSKIQVSSDSYIASNAYGRQVKVNRSRDKVCEVSFHNRESNVTLTGTVQGVEPDEARRLKSGLAFVVIGNLVPPYYRQYFSETKPQIDRPFEVTYSGDSIVLDIAKVWLIEHATGRVLNRDLQMY